jgi:hypothetical protein
LGEFIPLQRRRFRIADAARKTKPQRNHAPPAKPNSTVEHFLGYFLNFVPFQKLLHNLCHKSSTKSFVQKVFDSFNLFIFFVYNLTTNFLSNLFGKFFLFRNVFRNFFSKIFVILFFFLFILPYVEGSTACTEVARAHAWFEQDPTTVLCRRRGPNNLAAFG